METHSRKIITIIQAEILESCSQSTQNSVEKPKKLKNKHRRHIKIRPENTLELKFYHPRSLAPPKKEYLRSRMIRSHKRSIRQIFSKSRPSKILTFSQQNSNASLLWKKFCEVYLENQQTLLTISQTDLNYIVDKRKIWKNHQSTVKSYNSKFCRNYFHENPVKKSYYYFIELLFCDQGPESLKNKFDFSCCFEQSHGKTCLSTWENLKHYLQIELFNDLNIMPWRPSLEIAKDDLQISHNQPDWVNRIYINRYFSKQKFY